MNQRHRDAMPRGVQTACRPLLTAILLGLSLPATGSAQADPAPSREPLPPPVIHPHSTEICMNSRISYHGGWSATGTEQMLADVLHATAQAPVTGTSRTIYAATSANVYVYDAATHSLAVHKAGDWRSDHSAAFEVGVAADNYVDAGAAMHLAQLESVALWTGTANQLGSCPRASATTYANSNWNPPEPVDIAISFGVRSVPGFTSTLVAVSSDGSLPNPYTDGAVYMDSALVDLAYGVTFAAEDLDLSEISQLLWGAYGCSNHTATGRGGLVCASAVANYYLTRRVYSVGADAVYRFHNRRPPGSDLTTRDHRIELVQSGDARPGLREALAGLPEAPYYMIICVGQTGDWQELETGFAAMGAVLEASSMGLQGYETTALSTQQQAAIRAATGIPTADLPIVIVSLGRPIGGSDVEERDGAGHGLGLSIERPTVFGGGVTLHYLLPVAAGVDLAVYDCLGRQVRGLVAGPQERGVHSAFWNSLDDRGQPVPSGAYFCQLRAGMLAAGVRVVIVR
jgi:hypothetical protein